MSSTFQAGTYLLKVIFWVTPEVFPFLDFLSRKLISRVFHRIAAILFTYVDNCILYDFVTYSTHFSLFSIFLMWLRDIFISKRYFLGLTKTDILLIYIYCIVSVLLPDGDAPGQFSRSDGRGILGQRGDISVQDCSPLFLALNCRF